MKYATCDNCKCCNKNVPVQLNGFCEMKNTLMFLYNTCKHFKPLDDTQDYLIPTELCSGNIYKPKK